MGRKKIIIYWHKSQGDDINSQLKWICRTLGLFPIRDYNSSMYRVFIELIKDAQSERHSSSDEIAMRVGLTRGTVVHHLNNLMNSGIVIRQDNHYILKDRNVKEMIEGIRTEINELFDEMDRAAENIDKYLE
ncbi:MAG: ArsR family transcriptional regulator [Candidatus Woesearchaeota archaeon]